MTAYSDLNLLLGAYFHQDYFEVTGDEVSTINAFCVEYPGHAELLADDVTSLLSFGPSEAELADFAHQAGCAIDPRYATGTYRQWFAEIEAQARAYAAEHPGA